MPYELLNGNKPDLSSMPKWGQTIWVHDSKGSKLDACAEEAKWVGFDHNSMHTHHMYWPNKHCISIECDITFISNTVSIYLPPVSGSTMTPQITIGQPTSSSQQPLVMPLLPAAIPLSTLQIQVPQDTALPPVTTESGEEEMLEQEDDKDEVKDILEAPPTPPVTRPTVASQLKSRLPVQPPGTPKKPTAPSELT
jgi:hypothetical protein